MKMPEYLSAPKAAENRALQKDGYRSHGRKTAMNNYTIMIVDDEPDIQNLLEKSLSMEG